MTPYHDNGNEQLRSLFTDISNLHVLVVGDLILDNYIWGTVSRISPEAPVPVIHVGKKESRLGGAGNVAANLASLGAKVSLAGICGTDNYEDILLELCHQRKIEPLIIPLDHWTTTVKSRIIAQHQQLLRIDDETCEHISETIADNLFDAITPNSNLYDGVIISDYNKGLLTDNLTTEIIRHFSDIPVIVDPKSNDFQKYRGATTLKPNRKEFMTAMKQPDMPDSEIDNYARQMVSQNDFEGLVITLGEQGVFVLDNHTESMIIPTKAREVFDVSGAGDTFIASFICGLILSDDWFLAAKAANLAAGVVVGKIGTATVTIDEIFTNYNL